MISLPFRRPPPSGLTIDALYGTIVAQARSPAFYLAYGVADTVGARLDMIMLHLALVMQQLATTGAARSVGQPLFDRFCRDIDDNFREMGVGDLAVPKRMRRVAEDFHGRSKAYAAALAAEGVSALAQAVGRNVYGAAVPPLGAWRLAAYMRKVAQNLLKYDASAWAERAFCDPAAVKLPAEAGQA
jgi:cytochrome b pre-mRNA-processing protein 3